jgi:integrase
MGKLTAARIKTLKPGRYQDGDGLMLQVSPSGTASWLLRVYVKPQRYEFGIGSLKDLGLSQAREAAAQLRRQVKRDARAGLDPKAERKKLARVMPTFREAAKLAHQQHKATWRNGKHQDQWLSTLERYAYPTLGDMRVDAIEGPAVRDALLPIWLEVPETARRVRQRITAVLDWAYANGYRATEAPMRSLSKGLPRQPRRDKHFAAMPYADVPEFMATLRELDSSWGRLALQALILTAARSGEIRGARWPEIDFEAKQWTVPASRMKAGKVHVVPLSEAAVDIFKAAEAFRSEKSDLVFQGLQPDRALSDMTLLKVLRDMKIPYTVHGFRSSFRDWAAEETNFPSEVAEAALAHTVEDKVERAYKRTVFLEKRRSLMAAWSSYLAGAAPAVIPFPVRPTAN